VHRATEMHDGIAEEGERVVHSRPTNALERTA
jgi:hypothetical protein